MALLLEWVERIQRSVPEPLEGMIERFVQESAQEFFRESEAWRAELTVPLLEGVCDYDLRVPELPRDTFVGACTSVLFYPNHGVARRLQSTDARYVTPSEGTPTRYCLTGAGDLRINGTEAGSSLACDLVLYAGRGIAEIPDNLADRYFNTVNYGAMARLLRVPSRVWTDVGTAQHYEMLFRDGIAAARREARQDRSRPVRTVKFCPDY